MNSPRIIRLVSQLSGRDQAQLKWALSAKLTPDDLALLDRALTGLSASHQQQEHGGMGDK